MSRSNKDEREKLGDSLVAKAKRLMAGQGGHVDQDKSDKPKKKKNRLDESEYE